MRASQWNQIFVVPSVDGVLPDFNCSAAKFATGSTTPCAVSGATNITTVANVAASRRADKPPANEPLLSCCVRIRCLPEVDVASLETYDARPRRPDAGVRSRAATAGGDAA